MAPANLHSIKAELEEQMLCNKVIESMIARLRPDQLLKLDGKNFGQWFCDLKDLGRHHLNNSDFFGQPCQNRIYKRIGCAILLALINLTLICDVQDLDNSKEMVEVLTKHFQSFSCTGQLNLLCCFLTFQLDNNHSTVGVLSKLQDMLMEWGIMGVSMLDDVFLGFIVQNCVPAGS